MRAPDIKLNLIKYKRVYNGLRALRRDDTPPDAITYQIYKEFIYRLHSIQIGLISEGGILLKRYGYPPSSDHIYGRTKSIEILIDKVINDNLKFDSQFLKYCLCFSQCVLLDRVEHINLDNKLPWYSEYQLSKIKLFDSITHKEVPADGWNEYLYFMLDKDSNIIETNRVGKKSEYIKNILGG